MTYRLLVDGVCLTESERLKMLATEERENACVDSYCYPPLVAKEPTAPTTSARQQILERLLYGCATCEEDALSVDEMFV